MLFHFSTCCAWSITPSIIGQHFFAPSTAIEISPNSTNYCEVIYKPMQMSFETNHEVKNTNIKLHNSLITTVIIKKEQASSVVVIF